MHRALSCAWTGPWTLYERLRGTRKRARQACGPLKHVVRVGSEHVSGFSGTACKHARRCALSGRVFCVSDLVSCGPPRLS
eukprot:993427-Prymnesium_polylepis.1